MSQKPVLGITMGDPAGIGPEIAIQALAELETYQHCLPLLIGDAGVLKQAAQIVGADIELRTVAEPSAGRFCHGIVDVLDLENVCLDALVHGKIDTMAGRAAFEYIERVIQLALDGEVDAAVTGPIHKEALNQAGYHYAGHTEIFTSLTNARESFMMLVSGSFRAVHVSSHVSLREACDRVTQARVLAAIRMSYRTLQEMDISKPRIAVAGLNPHAGENGLFGTEDMSEIYPAVEAAKAEGIDVEGPIPPDTVFCKARGGLFDLVVAMYHDQGHIPVKLDGFRLDEQGQDWDSISGVNITLGLPIIRTSVDHGVAFDRAGQGRANSQSMSEAIRLAARLANAKRTG